jgi:hypothetical protein
MGFPILPGYDPERDTAKFLTTEFSLDVWQERSGADILRELRASGWQIRTETFYNIRLEALGQVKHQEQIYGLRPSSLIPEAWVTENPHWELGQDYLYQLEVLGESIEGEQLEIRYYSLYAKARLTKEELTGQILNLIAEHAKEYDFNVFDAEVVRVLGRPERLER